MAQTRVDKFRELQRRYQPWFLAVLAVAATILFILAQFFSGVQSFLLSKNVIAYTTLLIILDISSSIGSIERKPSLRTQENQDTAMPILLAQAKRCRHINADLLEYAGQTTLPLIRALRASGAHVQILVKHPETVTGHQLGRNLTTLDTLYTLIFNDYPENFECRCYRLPYSLRGRKFGDQLLEIGWLTPDVPRETTYGHNNPSILVEASSDDYGHYVGFFNRTFEDLWNHSSTEDAHVVLKRLSIAPTLDTSTSKSGA